MERAARDHCGQGDALTRREGGREKGHGAILTTLGSCDDGLWWGIGGAGAELRRRGARLTAAAQIRAAQGHGEKLER
jgi:hypothetical protein